MRKRALIVHGGWDGHEPKEVAHIFENILLKNNFEVDLSDTLDAYADANYLKSLDLIINHWTMGDIKEEYVNNISEAVISGVGLAGCHGGMCDAFRTNVDWQFMTGGNWVSHPGNDGVEYDVEIKHSSSPLFEGINNFKVSSEQYYLHVDPAVEVLATTRFPTTPGPHALNKAVDMPIAWTKRWGLGRVFYNSLGHVANIVAMPEVSLMIHRGFTWAAEGKDLYRGTRTHIDHEFSYTGMEDSQL